MIRHQMALLDPAFPPISCGFHTEVPEESRLRENQEEPRRRVPRLGPASEEICTKHEKEMEEVAKKLLAKIEGWSPPDKEERAESFKNNEPYQTDYAKCLQYALKHPESWNEDLTTTQIPECKKLMKGIGEGLNEMIFGGKYFGGK